MGYSTDTAAVKSDTRGGEISIGLPQTDEGLVPGQTVNRQYAQNENGETTPWTDAVVPGAEELAGPLASAGQKDLEVSWDNLLQQSGGTPSALDDESLWIGNGKPIHERDGWIIPGTMRSWQTYSKYKDILREIDIPTLERHIARHKDNPDGRNQVVLDIAREELANKYGRSDALGSKDATADAVTKVLADAHRDWVREAESPFGDPFSNLMRANSAQDLDKMAKQLEQRVGDSIGSIVEKEMATLGAHADTLGMSLPDYVERIYLPHLKEVASQQLMDTLIAREMPKNDAEYIVRQVGNSLTGVIMRMVTESRSQRQIKAQADSYTAQQLRPTLSVTGSNGYVPSHTATIGGGVASLSTDAALGWFKLGSWATRGAMRYALGEARFAAGAARSELLLHNSSSLWQRATAGWGRAVLESGGSFGVYDGATSLFTQLSLDGRVDIGEVGKATAGGVFTGGLLGFSGRAGRGLFGRYGINGLEKSFGVKLWHGAQGLGASAARFGLEAGTFAAADLMKDPGMWIREDGSVNGDMIATAFEDSAKFILGMRIGHIANGIMSSALFHSTGVGHAGNMRRMLGSAVMSQLNTNLKLDKELWDELQGKSEGIGKMLETVYNYSKVQPDSKKTASTPKRGKVPTAEERAAYTAAYNELADDLSWDAVNALNIGMGGVVTMERPHSDLWSQSYHDGGVEVSEYNRAADGTLTLMRTATFEGDDAQARANAWERSRQWWRDRDDARKAIASAQQSYALDSLLAAYDNNRPNSILSQYLTQMIPEEDWAATVDVIRNNPESETAKEFMRYVMQYSPTGRVIDSIAILLGYETRGKLLAVLDKEYSEMSEDDQRAVDMLRDQMLRVADRPSDPNIDFQKMKGAREAQKAKAGTPAEDKAAVAEVEAEVDSASVSYEEWLKRDTEVAGLIKGWERDGVDPIAIYIRLTERGYTKERLAPLAEYINAIARQQGFMEQAGTNLDDAVEKRMRMVTHTDGAVHEVVMTDGSTAYIVGGTYATDGGVGVKPFNVILVRGLDGEVHPSDGNEIQTVRMMSAEEYEARYRAELEAMMRGGEGPATAEGPAEEAPAAEVPAGGEGPKTDEPAVAETGGGTPPRAEGETPAAETGGTNPPRAEGGEPPVAETPQGETPPAAETGGTPPRTGGEPPRADTPQTGELPPAGTGGTPPREEAPRSGELPPAGTQPGGGEPPKGGAGGTGGTGSGLAGTSAKARRAAKKKNKRGGAIQAAIDDALGGFKESKKLFSSVPEDGQDSADASRRRRQRRTAFFNVADVLIRDGGVRRFAEFVREVYDELGEDAMAFIKAGYSYVRRELLESEDAAERATGEALMDDDGVGKFDLREFVKRYTFVDSLSDHVYGGGRLESLDELKRRAKDWGLDADEKTLKALYEEALKDAARSIIEDSEEEGGGIDELLDRLDDLNLQGYRAGIRNGRLDLASSYLTGRFAGDGGGDVLVVGADSGASALGVEPERLHMNDSSGEHGDSLQRGGYGGVSNEDMSASGAGAKLATEHGGGFSGVVSSGPAEATAPVTRDGLVISGGDKTAALNALDAMADDGRAVLLLNGSEYHSQGLLADNPDSAFIRWLYDHYNVLGVVAIPAHMRGSEDTGTLVFIKGRRSEAERASEEVLPPERAKYASGNSQLHYILKELKKRKTDGDVRRREDRPRPVDESPADAEDGPSGGQRGETPADGTPGDGPSAPAGGVGGDAGGGEGGPSGRSVGDGVPDEPGDNGPGGPAGPASGHGTGAGEGVAGEPGGTSGDGGGSGGPVPGRDGGNVAGPAVGPAASGVGLSGSEHPKPKPTLADTHVPYGQVGRSRQAELGGSVVPVSLADGTRESLIAVEKAHCGAGTPYATIDEWVAAETGLDINLLRQDGRLAKEQIDGIALAIHNMEQGEALIIGDQTGIGKGRQAAALLLYARKKGKKPIFMTQKPTLFTSMYEDIYALLRDADGAVPEDKMPKIWIVNDGSVKGGGFIKDGQDRIIVKAAAKGVQSAVWKSGKIPDGFDMVFVTYSQLQSSGMTQKKQWLSQVVRDNFLIMDESHTASGTESNTGDFIREQIVDQARGVTFLSATYAKRPEHTLLYAMKTKMRSGMLSFEQLREVLKLTGVPGQEFLSWGLNKARQLLRRERDMSDVEFEWKVDDNPERASKARASYDHAMDGFNKALDFHHRIVFPILNNIVEHLVNAGQNSNIRDANLYGKLYNFSKQLLLGIKVPAVIEEVKRQLADDKMPVIALENTLEGILTDYAPGEAMSSDDMSSTLLRLLDASLEFTSPKEITVDVGVPIISMGTKTLEDGHEVFVYRIDVNHSQAVRDAYLRSYEELREAAKDLPASPIDAIAEGLAAEGVIVHEITGRKLKTQLQGGKRVVVRRTAEESDGKAARDAFNNAPSGEKHVIILNKAGSTGINLHSGKNFANQKQRVMVIAQPLSDINDYMQMLGRIDRTNQAERGKYINLSVDIPAERRFFMMLKGKLASLNANTTGAQDGTTMDVQEMDFMNKYGSEVAVDYLKENPEVYRLMREPLGDTWGDDYRAKAGDINKITGRLALLSTERQEAVMKELSERYAAKIKELDESGMNDLRTQYEDLKARTISKRIFGKGTDKDGSNIFAGDTVIEEAEVDVLRKPYSSKDIQRIMKALLNGNDDDIAWAEDVRRRMDREKAEYRAEMAARRKEREADVKQRYADKRAILKEKTDMDDAQKQEAEERLNIAEADELSRMNATIDRAIYERENMLDELLDTMRHGSKDSGGFYVGWAYAIPDDLDTDQWRQPRAAVFLGYRLPKGRIAKSNVTAEFATLDGRRIVKVKMSETAKFARIAKCDADNRSSTVDLVTKVNDRYEWDPSRWDSAKPTRTRERVRIITGNMLTAVSQAMGADGRLPGRMVRYTDDKGEVKVGLVMNSSWSPAAARGLNAPAGDMRGDVRLALRRGRMLLSHDQSVCLGGSPDTGTVNIYIAESGTLRKPGVLMGDGRVTGSIDTERGDKGWEKVSLIVPANNKKGQRERGYYAARFDVSKLDTVIDALQDAGVRFPTYYIPEDRNERLDALHDQFTDPRYWEHVVDHTDDLGTLAFYVNRMRQKFSEVLDTGEVLSKYGVQSPEDISRLPLEEITDLSDLQGLSLAVLQHFQRFYVSSRTAPMAAKLLDYIDQVKLEKGIALTERLKNKGGVTIGDVRDLFYNYVGCSYDRDVIKALGDKVFGLVEDLPLNIKMEKLGAGVYGSQGGSGVSYDAEKLNLVPDEQKAMVLLHELIHSVTTYAIDMSVDPKLRGYRFKMDKSLLPKEVGAAVEQLYLLWKEVSRDGYFLRSDGGAAFYGVTSLHEFAAEMSNPYFRERLRMRGWWDRFKDCIKRIFGFTPKTADYDPGENMEAAAAQLLDYILDHFNEDAWNHHRVIMDTAIAIRRYRTDGTDPLSAAGELREEWREEQADAARLDGMMGSGRRATAHTRFSVVDDAKEVERLNKGKKVTRLYKTYLKEGDEYFAPMSVYEKRKGKDFKRKGVRLGQWLRSDEAPELAVPKLDKKGNVKWQFPLRKMLRGQISEVFADYNPYCHVSDSVLNDQLSSSSERPGLVVVEMEIPESELTSGYHADKAADPVGKKPWKAGPVQGFLRGMRNVILSRWERPVRELSDAETAQHIMEEIDGQLDTLPSNCFTPGVRAELEKLGMRFEETTSNGTLKEGPHKGITWNLSQKVRRGLPIKKEQREKLEKLGIPYERAAKAKNGKRYSVTDDTPDERVEDVVMPRVWSELFDLGQHDAVHHTSLDSVDDADVRDFIESEHAEGRRVRGWYDEKTGAVHLYWPDIRGEYDAMTTVAHETVGHKGLRGLLGEKGFRDFILHFYTHCSEGDLEAIDGRMERNGWDLFEAVEEYMAEVAEDYVPENWIERVGLALEHAGDAGRMLLGLSPDDLRYALWASRKNLNAGDPAGSRLKTRMRAKIEKDPVLAVEGPDGIVYTGFGSGKYASRGEASEALREGADPYAPFLQRDGTFKASSVCTPEARAMMAYYNSKMQRWSLPWVEAWTDYMVSYKILQDAMASGVKMQEAYDAYQAENAMQSIVTAKHELFMEQRVKPLTKALNKILPAFGKKVDEAWRSMDDYIRWKSGVERNRVLFVRDWSEDRRKHDVVTEDPSTGALAFDFDGYATPEAAFNAVRIGIDGQLASGAISAAQHAALLKDAARRCWDAWITDTVDQFNAERGRLKQEYDAGRTDLRGYADGVADHIRANIDAGYDPSDLKNDYSALHAQHLTTRTVTRGGRRVSEDVLDEDALLDELVEQELKADGVSGGNGVRDFWDEVKAMSDFALKSEYDGGMMNTETYDRIRGMMNWYVPMRDHQGDSAEDTWTYIDELRRPDGKAKVLTVKAKGRKTESADPLARLMTMCARSIQNAEHNKVRLRMYRLAMDSEATNGKTPLISVNRSWAEKVVKAGGVVEWQPVGPKIDSDMDGAAMAAEVARFEQEMKAKWLTGDARPTRGRLNLPVGVFEKESHAAQHAVNVYVNGVQHTMWLNADPRAAQAINGQLSPTMNYFARNVNRSMSQLQTSYSPTFMVRNMFRDFQFGFRNSFAKYGARYTSRLIYNYGEGLITRKMWRYWKRYNEGTLNMGVDEERWFKEWLDNGGKTGFGDFWTFEKYRAELKRGLTLKGKVKGRSLARTVIGGVEFMNKLVENGMRYTAYRTSRELGKNITDSIKDAKEVSVNFNRRGAGFMTASGNDRTWNEKIAGATAGIGQNFWLYFNPTMQSIAQMYRNLGRGDTAARTALAFGIGPMLFGALQPWFWSMMADLLYDEDPFGNPEDYDKSNIANLAEWKRRKGLNIYCGNGKWLTLPSSIEGSAFQGIGELIGAKLFGRDDLLNPKRSLGMEVAGELSQLLPVDWMGQGQSDWISFFPSLSQPILQVGTNQKWTGAPLWYENPYNKDDETPLWTRSYKSTNICYIMLCRWLTDWLNGGAAPETERSGAVTDKILNPAAMENLANGYGGGMLRDLTGMVGSAVDELGSGSVREQTHGGRKTDSHMDWSQVPMVKALLAEGGEEGKRYRLMTAYYEASGEAADLERLIKAYAAEDGSDPWKTARKQTLDSKADALLQFKEIEKLRKDLNKAKKNAQSDEELKSLEKADLQLLEDGAKLLRELRH